MNQHLISISRKEKRKRQARAQRQFALMDALHLERAKGDVVVVQLTASNKKHTQLKLPRSFRHKPNVDRALQQANHIERKHNPLLNPFIHE